AVVQQFDAPGRAVLELDLAHHLVGGGVVLDEEVRIGGEVELRRLLRRRRRGGFALRRQRGSEQQQPRRAPGGARDGGAGVHGNTRSIDFQSFIGGPPDAVHFGQLVTPSGTCAGQ